MLHQGHASVGAVSSGKNVSKFWSLESDAIVVDMVDGPLKKFDKPSRSSSLESKSSSSFSFKFDEVFLS